MCIYITRLGMRLFFARDGHVYLFGGHHVRMVA
jgi:hypothetical protein